MVTNQNNPLPLENCILKSILILFKVKLNQLMKNKLVLYFGDLKIFRSGNLKQSETDYRIFYISSEDSMISARDPRTRTETAMNFVEFTDRNTFNTGLV